MDFLLISGERERKKERKKEIKTIQKRQLLCILTSDCMHLHGQKQRKTLKNCQKVPFH